uniref:Ras-related protein Rab n=1 Tax=Canis lupus familiaris TaxID=9615 RepID=A0A8C0QDL6_CANLF
MPAWGRRRPRRPRPASTSSRCWSSASSAWARPASSSATSTSSSPSTTGPPSGWTSPSRSSTGTAGRWCACSSGTSRGKLRKCCEREVVDYIILMRKTPYYWKLYLKVKYMKLFSTRQERFGNMTRVYYKEAVGAFVVFDISRGSTFEAVLKWKSDLDSKVHLPNGSPIPAVLLANKCDQKKDGGQNPPQMDQFCKEHGFTGWFETSAKDNINIDEAARFLVENILANHQSFPNEENDAGKVKLDQETLTAESKSQCC